MLISVATRRLVRSFLAVGIAVGLLVPTVNATSDYRRSLSFYHTHTGQELTVVYSVNGEYVDSELQRVNAFLGDFRNGASIRIDPELLDYLYDLREAVGSSATYEVISAYRSPETNDMLRQRGSGVARKSQHLLGKAIDVRLRGTETLALRDAALKLQRGGVGYYEKSDFVHVDTARVRRW